MKMLLYLCDSIISVLLMLFFLVVKQSELFEIDLENCFWPTFTVGYVGNEDTHQERIILVNKREHIRWILVVEETSEIQRYREATS